MEPIIKVDNVSMCFNLSKEKHESLKEYFLAMVQGRLQYDEFYALKDVSLDIMPGDFYGLVGLNGSGKSTLLKTIAGVYKPSKGKVTVRGSIAPLIELGAGFDMDLTARENIYLNGTVLGFSPKYLDEKFDEIVEFSELQNFLDVPLKNYSSGMVARIGFAIATITKPDILIADEVLSVGDFLFQQKCEKRMQELMAGGTTVILVSHSIEQIERMCSKVAWLSHGHLKMNGDTATVHAPAKSPLLFFTPPNICAFYPSSPLPAFSEAFLSSMDRPALLPSRSRLNRKRTPRRLIPWTSPSPPPPSTASGLSLRRPCPSPLPFTCPLIPKGWRKWKSAPPFPDAAAFIPGARLLPCSVAWTRRGCRPTSLSASPFRPTLAPKPWRW